MVTRYHSITFKYFIKIPGSQYSVAAGRDDITGRTRLFLLSEYGRIYVRNGLRGSWEIAGEDESIQIRRQITQAIRAKSAPCYTAAHNLTIGS